MRKLMSPRVTPWINYTANIYQSDPKVQTIFTISCWLFNDKGWDELEYVIASNSTTYSELLIQEYVVGRSLQKIMQLISEQMLNGENFLEKAPTNFKSHPFSRSSGECVNELLPRQKMKASILDICCCVTDYPNLQWLKITTIVYLSWCCGSEIQDRFI